MINWTILGQFKGTLFLSLTYFSSKLYHLKLVVFTPALSVKTGLYYSD